MYREYYKLTTITYTALTIPDTSSKKFNQFASNILLNIKKTVTIQPRTETTVSRNSILNKCLQNGIQT